jgi:phage FluMu protein Com
MNDKVYFIHKGTKRPEADFFDKGIKKEDVRGYIDYFIPDCKYVKAFLQLHPEYTYVGSTDNMYYKGRETPFGGYEEVRCPSLKEVNGE